MGELSGSNGLVKHNYKQQQHKPITNSVKLLSPQNHLGHNREYTCCVGSEICLTWFKDTALTGTASTWKKDRKNERCQSSELKEYYYIKLQMTTKAYSEEC